MENITPFESRVKEVGEKWKKEWGDFILERFQEYNYTEGHEHPLQEAKFETEQILNFWLSLLRQEHDRVLREVVEKIKQWPKSSACISKPYEVPAEIFDILSKQTGLAYNKALSDLSTAIEGDLTANNKNK